MVKQLFSVMAVAIILVSCGGVSTEEINERIANHEKALMDLSEKRVDPEVMDSARFALIDDLLSFHRSFPEDQKAPVNLGKLHMIYSAMNSNDLAVAYGDTLLDKYPGYVNRAMIIESQIGTYEMFIEPRNVKKIEAYLKMLLKENPDFSDEKKSEIQYRLDHLDVSTKDIMKQQLTELN